MSALAAIIAAQCSIVAAAPASAAPVSQPTCPSYLGLSSVAVDPSTTIAVKAAQEFAIARRGAAGGNIVWRVRPAGGDAKAISFVRYLSIGDAELHNVDRAPGTPALADGPTVDLYVYQAPSVGTATITFDLFQIGAVAPLKSDTFTVVVAPPTAIC